MNALRSGVATVALAVILAACTTGAPAAPSPEAAPSAPVQSAAPSPSPAPVASPSPAPAEPDVSELTANDLLLAALTWYDLSGLLPAETWWPYFPEFNVGFSPYSDDSPDPTVASFVIQKYERVLGPSKRQIVSSAVLYEDATAASRGLSRQKEINEAASVSIAGPIVGDEAAYFTRVDFGSNDYPYTATLRFRAGRVVARIAVLGDGLEEPATLARYAAPLVERIGALLGGTLRAEPLPAEVAQLMPPPSDTVGSILGAAVVPVEAWALVDTSGTPDVTAAMLRSLGVDSLGFGRASLAADPSQVVEATLFEFPDAASASAWVESFTTGVGATGLDPGTTGTQSAFTSYDGWFYELQFATGSFVGDVICFAPYGETSAACEGPIRQLAEAWFAALSGG